ncbi:MAG: AI-2E family transporter [Lachnospiraceae bacterium]
MPAERKAAMPGMNDSGTQEPGLLRKAFGRWLGLFLVLVTALLFYLFIVNLDIIFGYISYVAGIIKPVIYGAVIAYILNPLMKIYQRLVTAAYARKGRQVPEKKKGMFNGISITLALVTGIFIIVILFIMIIPQIITTMVTLVNNLPGQVDAYYKELVEKIENNRFIADTMQEVVLQGTKFLDEKMTTEVIPWMRTELLPNLNTYAKQFASGIAAFLSVLYNLFIGLIVAIYLLGSKRVFAAQAKKIMYGLLKKHNADMVIYYLRVSNNMFSGFISGKIVDSAIIGLICFVAMTVLNLPYTMLVSVIVGVTNIIPVFGPYIGAVPSALLILLVDPKQALYFLVLIIIIQQLDGNIIGPAILGESTGLSAFWVLFSILLFGGFWGIMGMLVGCPLFAVIYRVIKDFISMKLRKKELSDNTQEYMDLKSIEISASGLEYVKYTSEELNSKKKKSSNKLKKAVVNIKKPGSKNDNRNNKKNKGGKLD